MPTRLEIEGYENFCKYVENYKSENGPLYIYFSGSKLPTGESWCSDCNDAHDAIENSVKLLPQDNTFLTVYVGDRPFWKDNKCSFRQDSRLKLLELPTILKWKSVNRLSGEQAAKEDLLQLLFIDDEE